MAKRERERRKIAYTNTKKWVEEHDQDWKSKAYQIPEGMSRFKFKVGKVRFDIIPFVAGEGNPNADKGNIHWERTFWVHSGVGADNDSYCCLKRTFGEKACPGCEELARLRAEGAPDKVVQAAKPKERQLMCFRVKTEAGTELQLYEGSHYNGFGELLKDKLDACDDDSKSLDFFHLEGGSSCVVKAKEETYLGKTYAKPSNVEFDARSKALPESILDEVPCLDDLLIHTDYDDFLEALEGGKVKAGKKKADEDDEDEDEDSVLEEEDEDEDDEDEKPTRKKAKKPADDEDEDDEDDSELDDDDEDEDDEPPPKKKPKKKPEPEDDEDDDEDEEDAFEEDDEDDDDVPFSTDGDDDEDEDEDEDEDDEPPPKKKPKKK